jgi:hypothetical protein
MTKPYLWSQLINPLTIFTMKNILLTIGVALVISACSTANFATHPLSVTPTTSRQALIYDNHVVIVTKTKMSVEDYNKIIATTVKNKEERK